MIEIDEEEDRAKEELKRADHMVYVSLKYTRTADVIKNIIKRLISSFEYTILDALEYYKNRKKIDNIPESSGERLELFEKLFKENIKQYIKLYQLLKKMDNAPYQSKEEFRKNLTFMPKIGNKVFEVKMYDITEYFLKTKEFYSIVRSQLS